MPTGVILVSSDGTNRNLSDEAYAAFTEPGTTVSVSALSGQPKVTATNGRGLVIMTEMVTVDEMPGDAVIVEPHPRARRKRPRNVTVKERLDAAEVAEMLDGPAGWKLAVPSGTSTDVLTADMLREAWDTNASGTVTIALRGPTSAEQAALDDAKERITPKAGAARVAAGIAAPVGNIALLAAGFGGFLALKGDEEVARPYLLVVAAVCALASVALSLIGTFAVKKSTVRLSRLDLVQSHLGTFGRPTWLPNVCVALFVAALAAAVFSVVPAKSSPDAARASFGEPTISQSGAVTKVTFTVKWENLKTEAAGVSTIVTGAGLEQQTEAAPKGSDGSASQEISVTVRTPTKLTVSTQALDADNEPVGDRVVHTYNVR